MNSKKSLKFDKFRDNSPMLFACHSDSIVPFSFFMQQKYGRFEYCLYKIKNNLLINSKLDYLAGFLLDKIFFQKGLYYFC